LEVEHDSGGTMAPFRAGSSFPGSLARLREATNARGDAPGDEAPRLVVGCCGLRAGPGPLDGGALNSPGRRRPS
jgi:hypothetical protein